MLRSGFLLTVTSQAYHETTRSIISWYAAEPIKNSPSNYGLDFGAREGWGSLSYHQPIKKCDGGKHPTLQFQRFGASTLTPTIRMTVFSFTTGFPGRHPRHHRPHRPGHIWPPEHNHECVTLSLEIRSLQQMHFDNIWLIAQKKYEATLLVNHLFLR